jgi:hypothetical protein
MEKYLVVLKCVRNIDLYHENQLLAKENRQRLKQKVVKSNYYKPISFINYTK